MKDIGRITRWKEKESSNGLMEEFIKEITSTTRNMASVEFGGPTVESTKASGKVEFNTGKANTKEKTVPGKKADGNTANVYVDFE